MEEWKKKEDGEKRIKKAYTTEYMLPKTWLSIFLSEVFSPKISDDFYFPIDYFYIFTNIETTGNYGMFMFRVNDHEYKIVGEIILLHSN